MGSGCTARAQPRAGSAAKVNARAQFPFNPVQHRTEGEGLPLRGRHARPAWGRGVCVSTSSAERGVFGDAHIARSARWARTDLAGMPDSRMCASPPRRRARRLWCGHPACFRAPDPPEEADGYVSLSSTRKGVFGDAHIARSTRRPRPGLAETQNGQMCASPPWRWVHRRGDEGVTMSPGL